MIRAYLYRLYDTILSRGYVDIERLDMDDRSEFQGTIEGTLRYYDGSRLEFNEALILRENQLIKLRYAYHYQNGATELIFRYDNAPHLPNLPTYPDHKHVGSGVQPALAPDLGDVLREIDELIFGNIEA